LLQVIDALDKVSHFSKQSEPGTLRYATFVSRDETDERNIWVIEEYAHR
jgi:quinol monooxygenase YgiN